MDRYINNPLTKAAATSRVQKENERAKVAQQRKGRAAAKALPAKVERALQKETPEARLDRKSLDKRTTPDDEDDIIIKPAKRARTSASTPCNSREKASRQKQEKRENRRRVKPFSQAAKEELDNLISKPAASNTVDKPKTPAKSSSKGKRKAESALDDSPAAKKVKSVNPPPSVVKVKANATPEQKSSDTKGGDASHISPPVDSKKESASVEREVKAVFESNSPPRGLLNTGLSCFANAATQFLQLAWTASDVAKIRGKDQLDKVACDSEYLLRFRPEIGNDLSSMGEYEKLKKRIAKLAPRVSRLSSYYGLVLQALMAPAGEGSNTATQIFFQHLLAAWEPKHKTPYGAEWNGVTRQQDSAEFVHKIITLLDEEEAIDMGKFQTRFDLHWQCSRCNHREERLPSIQETLSITLMRKGPILKDLMDSVINQKEEPVGETAICDNCQGVGSKTAYTTLNALPDNLVLMVEREDLNLNIDIPYDQGITIANKQYRVSAVIKHKGPNKESGHYWAIRRHNDRFYVMDDSSVSLVKSTANIQDSPRAGRTCAVLFTAVPAAEKS